jgi:hypothetical protein
VLLVGCSLLGSRQQSAPEPLPLIHKAVFLHPAFTQLAVCGMSATRAHIVWHTPWRGTSQVLYGTEPYLSSPYQLKRCPGRHNQASLEDLKPATRYYFQVETIGPMGAACSAVCSFLTP